MKTCCPSCQTIFRVLPDQLRIRTGQVRCGSCHHVFNALDYLLEEDGIIESISLQNPEPITSVPEPSLSHHDTTTQTAPQNTAPINHLEEEPTSSNLAQHKLGMRWIAATNKAKKEKEKENSRYAGRVKAQPFPLQFSRFEEETIDTSSPYIASVKQPDNTDNQTQDIPDDQGHSNSTAIASHENTVETQPSEATSGLNSPSPASGPEITLLETTDEESERRTKTKDRRRTERRLPPREELEEVLAELHEPEKPAFASGHSSGWRTVFCVFTLITLILGQLAFYYRGSLAISTPQLKPVLAQFAATFGTTIPLAQEIDQITIESSDLQSDPSHGGLLVLGATLRNHASYAQKYPMLELSLTDTQNEPSARRVFTPQEYLPDTQANSPAFIEHSDLAIRLWLNTGSLPTSGYHIKVFYP